MDMLCQMDASHPRGVLLVGNRAATNAEIARIVGGDKRTVERLLAELETNGVFSRDDEGAPFCRRMTRESAVSQQNAENGKLGGNPVLLKTNKLPEMPVKPSVKADTDTDTDIEREKERNFAKKEVHSPAARADSGSRLSADWVPGDLGWDYAQALGLDPKKVFIDFQGYWLSKPGALARKTNWLLTWQKWCRTEAERRRERGRRQR
jgi:hypothetical protein